MTTPTRFFGSARYHVLRGASFLVLAAVFVVLLGLTGKSVPWLGYVAIGVMAVAGLVHFWLAYSVSTGRAVPSPRSAAAPIGQPSEGVTMTEWWYNHKTGEVEEGPQSLGSERDGPFATREDAAHAPEIIAERARKWAEDDAARD